MKIENPKTEDQSFGKGLAKSFAKTTVETAGVWTGLGIALIALGQAVKFKNDRYDRKHQIENN